MTRELVASAMLTGGELPLLALQRVRPEHSLPELCTAARRVGNPVRVALFHLQGCAACVREALVGDGRLCERGARILGSAA